MKETKIANLKKGDWITDTSSNFEARKGKFAIARVKEFRVVFDKAIWLDMDKDIVEKRESNASIGYDDLDEEEITKLNRTDLKEVNRVVTKLKIIDGLKDESKLQEEYD